MYDVIVIGAGPSGCVTASILAKNGLKVLLLEKSKLPRYKSCSGILIEKSIRFIENVFGQKVPDIVCCAPVDNRGMVFVDDNGREQKFESRGLNIWRDKFDFWLSSLAKKYGVEVKDESCVSDVQEKDNIACVAVNGAAEYAKFVVDCSGAVGIDKRRENIITFQTYNAGKINLDPHYFYAYLQPELSGYDAWFNVKDDSLVLGVATANSKDISKYYGNFIAYMEKNYALKIDREIKTDKWLIRNIQPPFDVDYGSGVILKAGESAGFLNPMGEGISCAMESGYAAALAIISNLTDKQNAIRDYERNAIEIKNYMQRQWKLVGRMSNKFSFMLS
ncbi:MAG: NAD(P)/FAD-dependent oxidoreductase [Clostridia bacterium]|nr:NAD(P)/FAD-dependent oxidoreductase [Clostridia bacterium]MDE7328604.1 NAD(P)/FAD-dependent oxidoreductase [Clostridia bacterium]